MRQAISVFSRYSLALTKECLAVLSGLSPEALSLVADGYFRENPTHSIVDHHTLALLLTSTTNNTDNDSPSLPCAIFSAFDSASNAGLFSDASTATFSLRSRHATLAARLKKISQITTIASLQLSTTSLIFGLLVEKNKSIYLEDLSGSIKLRVGNHVLKTDHYFIVGTFVVVEGELLDEVEKVFEVVMIGMVPIEPRIVSDSKFGSAPSNYAIPHHTQYQLETILSSPETIDLDPFIVILSDLALDTQESLQNLHILFTGYSQSRITPFAFLLFGPFTSSPTTTLASFTALSDLLSQFPIFKQSKFIFIPASKDPFLTMLLPRPKVPKKYTERLERLGNCVFVSNPCRVNFCGVETVVYASDVKKFERGCIFNRLITSTDSENNTNDSGKANERTPFLKSVKTIFSQTHLVPFANTVAPRVNGFEKDLEVEKVPHLFVFPNKSFESVVVEGCCCVSPGSFKDKRFCAVYLCGLRVEECKLD
ncbi:DNA polymerase epsilon subunit 2 [Nowakowskiella sp. JEL0407]|nr:DNA polymerase epsilon subunit 2 [Nowakowskiella sp. JEL0407]